MLLVGCESIKSGDFECKSIRQEYCEELVEKYESKDRGECRKFIEVIEDGESVWLIVVEEIEDNWFCDREQTTKEDGYYFKYVKIKE